MNKPPMPSPELIESMCLRYDHSFGLPSGEFMGVPTGLTEQQKDSIRRTMHQLWEEVAGEGFYEGPDTIKAIWAEAERLEKELEDLNGQVYCPTCGSCGEEGCCHPTRCKTVQQMYCDTNLKAMRDIEKDLDELDALRAQVKELAEALEKIANAEDYGVWTELSMRLQDIAADALSRLASENR